MTEQQRKDDWFDVDREGLARLLERKGTAFAVLELVSNAWDQQVTTVEVTLEVASKGKARLVVTDDDPEGFADLSHAYTLFAKSGKLGNPEQRGRFNLGEKLVLSLCTTAEVASTKGTVRFGPEGRTFDPDAKRERGTRFEALLRMKKADVEDACTRVRELIPPAGIRTLFNGLALEDRVPYRELKVTLPTEAADDEGILRKTARKTIVRLYEPLEGEKASLYEMGVPVVETGDRWHYDVQQKVPLNFERDNVTPAYLRTLRTAVLNEVHEEISGDDANQTWVRDALSDDKVDPAAVKAAVEARFGKAVIYDPSDPEANKIAVAEGYTLVTGSMLSGKEWAHVKDAEALRPAGQVTPSPKVETDTHGDKGIPRDQWTPGMVRIAEYTQRVAEHIIEGPIVVSFSNLFGQSWNAAFGRSPLGPSRFIYNLGRLGHRWFNEPDETKVDALIIHELGHYYSSDHLSHEYFDALCTLGARLKQVADRCRL